MSTDLVKSLITDIFIGRNKKENKDVLKTFRLKQSEVEELDKMKEDLNFNSRSDLIRFSLDIMSEFYKWHEKGYKFFIGHEGKDDYREIKIDFDLDEVSDN